MIIVTHNRVAHLRAVATTSKKNIRISVKGSMNRRLFVTLTLITSFYQVSETEARLVHTKVHCICTLAARCVLMESRRKIVRGLLSSENDGIEF